MTPHKAILVSLMTLALTGISAADDASQVDRYTITFNSDRPEIAHIDAQITLSEQTLRMAPWGHPYLARGWATFVDNFVVEDETGRPVEFADAGRDTWGAWKIDAPDGSRLHVRYDTEFSQDEYDWNSAGGQDSRPALSGEALFLVTKALFVYSPSVAAAEVTIVKPDSWKISAPWPLLPGSQSTFSVDSWIGLVNNALVIGDHYERTIQDGNMAIILAIDRPLADSVDLFERTFRLQLGAYRELFGGTPESQYLVTIRAANEDDGESFENSFNQVITPGRLGDRAIVWANTMSHELFHYWNGNHVLVGADKSDVEWFSEGFTEYYSSLTLHRTGLIDESLWFKKLETYLGRHFVTTRMWPVEPESLVQAGQDKHKNWLRIYGGGATMALVLDIEIRAATGGEKGLDEVMRLLTTRFGHSGARYRVTDILEAANDVSGSDFTRFFEDHILGTTGTLDVARVLSKAGLNVEQFSDEFYLSHASETSQVQRAIFNGIVKIKH